MSGPSRILHDCEHFDWKVQPWRSGYRILQAPPGTVSPHVWRAMTPRMLTKQYASDSPLWDWLRAWGFRRVSTTSGPSGERRDDAPRECKLRLADDDRARLDRLTERLNDTRSAVVATALKLLERHTRKD